VGPRRITPAVVSMREAVKRTKVGDTSAYPGAKRNEFPRSRADSRVLLPVVASEGELRGSSASEVELQRHLGEYPWPRHSNFACCRMERC